MKRFKVVEILAGFKSVVAFTFRIAFYLGRVSFLGFEVNLVTIVMSFAYYTVIAKDIVIVDSNSNHFNLTATAAVAAGTNSDFHNRLHDFLNSFNLICYL